MRALSQDLRERIIAAVDRQDGSRRQIAQRFCVDVSTITRLLQLRRQTDSLQPRPRGDDHRATLDTAALERLRQFIEKHPDATLRDLREKLGVGGSLMILWRS